MTILLMMTGGRGAVALKAITQFGDALPVCHEEGWRMTRCGARRGERERDRNTHTGGLNRTAGVGHMLANRTVGTSGNEARGMARMRGYEVRWGREKKKRERERKY